MEFALVLFALVGWALAIMLAWVLMQMADDQDRAARRVERGMNLDPATPVAKPGSHTDTGNRRRSSNDGPNPG